MDGTATRAEMTYTRPESATTGYVTPACAGAHVYRGKGSGVVATPPRAPGRTMPLPADIYPVSFAR
jgi:hypothetical protein